MSRNGIVFPVSGNPFVPLGGPLAQNCGARQPVSDSAPETKKKSRSVAFLARELATRSVDYAQAQAQVVALEDSAACTDAARDRTETEAAISATGVTASARA